MPVKEFIEAQSAEVREKIFADLNRLKRFGVRLGAPYVRKLEGRDFWELRTKLGGDIYRTFYFAHTGRKFVLLHAFQKTPRKELDTAEARMKDYLERAEEAEGSKRMPGRTSKRCWRKTRSFGGCGKNAGRAASSG